jgi:hypothetical protein
MVAGASVSDTKRVQASQFVPSIFIVQELQMPSRRNVRPFQADGGWSIAQDDALILPHRANPRGWDSRERQGFCVAKAKHAAPAAMPIG